MRQGQQIGRGHRAFTRWNALLGLLAACGGGESVGTAPPPPPPPPPVVTTIGVTPAAAAIAVEDTVRLTATVKDQHGAVMSGTTPTWSSDNPTIATVSAEGLVAGVGTGQATVTATVGDKKGTAQLTVTPLVRVALDLAAARSRTVGRAGDTITVTATSGLVYVLEIPADALDSAVPITMTPVTAFKHLPLSGGLVGAVELAPAGLRFKRPAILRIKTLPNVAAGLKLVAMYYDGDGARVVPGPAARGTGDVVLMIPQIGIELPPSSSSASRSAMTPFFPAAGSAGGGTGAGAALATPQDLLTVPWPSASSAQQVAFGQLAGLSMPADQAAIVAAMHTWFQSMVPLIQGANDDLRLRDALIEYTAWDAQFNILALMDPLGQPLLAALTPDIRSGETALLTAFRFVSNGLNLTCASTRSLVAANSILYLYRNLQAVDRLQLLETPGTGYPEDEVFEDLCVSVVVTDSTLVDPLQKDVPAALDLRFGIRFGTDPNLSATVPFRLNLALFGTTQDGLTQVATDPLGKYHTSLTATGTNNVIVSVTACIEPAAGRELQSVCVVFNIDRPMGRTVTGDVKITSDAGLTQIADVSKIVGSLTISGANVTSKDLRELPMLTEVTETLTIDALPALTTLAGLTSLTKVKALNLTSNPALKNPARPPRITDLPALYISGGGLNDLSGFFGLAHIGRLALTNVAVTTLAPLRRTVVDGDLFLSNLAGLTSLDGLRLAPTLPSIVLSDLPHLADMTAFDAVTEVTQVVMLRVAFPTSTPFPTLQKVAFALHLYVDAQTPPLTFPALQVVRILRVDLHQACQGRSTPFALALPALQSLRSVDWAGPSVSAIGCYTLPAPLSTMSLESVRITGGGFTSVSLARVQNSGTPNISRGGDLQIMGPDVTQVHVSGSVNINGNVLIKFSPNLRSVSFGGSVTILALLGDMNSFGICSNASLTTISLAAPAHVNGGRAIIAGNPNFVQPSKFPLTATGGVIIQPAVHPRC